MFYALIVGYSRLAEATTDAVDASGRKHIEMSR